LAANVDDRQHTKVVLVGGAGGIGSSVAFNLLRTATAYDVVIVDSREEMITSHVMDLVDTLSLGGASSVRGGTLVDTFDADIVVVSASVPLRLNSSRDVFLQENATLLMSIVDPMAASGWSGVFLLMTNPVDPLLTWVQARTGWDRTKVLGYSLNDTQRFRTGIALALDVQSRSVECSVVGEHGAGQVLVWGSVTVNGMPTELTARQRYVVRDYVENWYVRHVALDSGRTSTWSSGIGGALMIEALTLSSPTPFPASFVLDGEYGVFGVSSSTPALLGPEGIRESAPVTLAADELAALKESATKIADLAAQLPT
jgi:malate/lactate dehydrogenase